MFFDGVMMIFSKVYTKSKDKTRREDALQLNFLLVLEVHISFLVKKHIFRLIVRLN